MLIEIHLSQIRISDSKREKYVRYIRTFYLCFMQKHARFSTSKDAIWEILLWVYEAKYSTLPFQCTSERKVGEKKNCDLGEATEGLENEL